MDIAFAVLSFLFMLFFLITIRAILNKDKCELLIFATSVFFGAILLGEGASKLVVTAEHRLRRTRFNFASRVRKENDSNWSNS
ncbi:hypothetical protein DFP97_117149 [Paenibacillus prosopidis]|uniref:Uncharacterized protein n=1 Tax=Paenibacillus prosopidis TaxID=630520 RepID=A0A368VN52_9BACL|nr:hypothetical protein DFP97_117149 [Paenibacillus prosopidis]